MLFAERKRGQVTIFIIIAVIIVAGILLLFAIGEKPGKISPSLQQVEDYFLSCIEDYSRAGVSLLEDKGGYIYPPEFEPGNMQNPFSSQLDFQGTGVQYWYYVSGNGIAREKVPSSAEMERQLEEYIKKNLRCDFSSFYEKGYEVELGDLEAKAKISDNQLAMAVTADLSIKKDDDSVVVSSHERVIETKLGKFYNQALDIYNYEKTSMFLENYSLDALRLYAPVDGVELSCSPKVWNKNNVDKDLKEALSANIGMIRLKGEYSSKADKYFVLNQNTENAVNFIYDEKWPTRIEVWDSKDGMMIAEPVGMQQGLGILGFCYVPYHFVYDVYFPVLIQIYDEKEIFQFPVAVVIEKNNPREALNAESSVVSESELCSHDDAEIKVYTYNVNLEPVEAKINFECLGERCEIGETKTEGNDAVLQGNFPLCSNGFVSASAEGYSVKRVMISTNEETEANVILDRLYNLSLNLKVDSKDTNDYAIISFSSENNYKSVVWPEQKSVELSEGSYNVSVYVYKNSSITIPGMTKEQCSEVSKPGILGVLGMKEEKCFNINLPEQKISNIISAGGKTNEYFIVSQLEKGAIEVNVGSVPIPGNIEQLQDSYNILESNNAFIDFKENEI